MILLTGCTTGSSEQRSASVCPPVVAYTLEEQRRVADEVDALPEGSVIVGWLADYMVLRGQLRVCQQDVNALFWGANVKSQITGRAP